MKKYQKDAQNRYNSKFDIVQARLPKGTKERIQSLDYTINAFIVEAVETMLKSLETPTATILEPTESVSTEKETKEVDQMAAVEVMPWEEGYTEPKPDPVYEQEQPKQEEDKITLENWQKQIDENRAEEIKKLEEEEEQRKNRLKEIQEATKNDIVNYVKRVRNGSEMTEEEKKKEADREEWKKKNNKEFGV